MSDEEFQDFHPSQCVILHIAKDESLEIAHLISRNSEIASASGGKPPDPPLLTDVVILHIVKDESFEIAHLTSRHSKKLPQGESAPPSYFFSPIGSPW